MDHHGLIFHSPSQSQLRGALSQTPGQGEHVPRGRQQVRVTPGSQGRRGHARGDHTGPAHVCARFKSWWRAVMVTSVAELSKRRTGDPTRRRGTASTPAQRRVPGPPVQSCLEVTEMSRAAGSRPGLSGGQVAAASPLLWLLLLLACLADACRGKMPPSVFCLPRPSGSCCTGCSPLPPLPPLWVSGTHLPLKPWSGSGLQPAGEAVETGCRLRSGS